MSNNNLSRWLTRALFAALLFVPGLTHAQSVDPTRGMWMAASSTEASLAGREFGRLTMANGALEFQATGDGWRLPLSDVKRIGSSKTVAKALEIESTTGQVYYIGILDGQLTPTAPGKAMQMIQRAVKMTPAPAPARTAIVAAGAGQQ